VLANKPGLVTEFADASCGTRGRGGGGACHRARARRERLGVVQDWLVKYYRKHGRRREARSGSKKSFLRAHPPKQFQALREGVAAGTWTRYGPSAQNLEGSKRFGPSPRSPARGDVPRAWSCSPDAAWERGTTSGGGAGRREKLSSGSARVLYGAGRSRDPRTGRRTYQQAVQYLKRMKAVYSPSMLYRLGTYLQSLRRNIDTYCPARRDAPARL